MPFIWWEHPSCVPGDLGRHLEAHGLTAVERVAGMCDRPRQLGRNGPAGVVRFTEIVDSDGMEAEYEDLIVRYWELPTGFLAMVAERRRGTTSLVRFVGRNRWVAQLNDERFGC